MCQKSSLSFWFCKIKRLLGLFKLHVSIYSNFSFSIEVCSVPLPTLKPLLREWLQPQTLDSEVNVCIFHFRNYGIESGHFILWNSKMVLKLSRNFNIALTKVECIQDIGFRDFQNSTFWKAPIWKNLFSKLKSQFKTKQTATNFALYEITCLDPFFMLNSGWILNETQRIVFCNHHHYLNDSWKRGKFFLHSCKRSYFPKAWDLGAFNNRADKILTIFDPLPP